MARTANLPSEVFDGSYIPRKKDGSVETGKTWRDVESGILMHFNKDAEAVPVVFSISASCSEAFNDAIEAAVQAYNAGLPEKEQESRAHLIRQYVADAIGYDLSTEPEPERGGGLAAYREKVNKATKTYDVLASLLASNPELAKQLAEQGVEL